MNDVLLASLEAHHTNGAIRSGINDERTIVRDHEIDDRACMPIECGLCLLLEIENNDRAVYICSKEHGSIRAKQEQRTQTRIHSNQIIRRTPKIPEPQLSVRFK